MPYSFQLMETHVRTLVRRHNLTNWHYDGGAPNTIRDEVFARYPNGRIERLVTLAGQGSQNAKTELLACEIAAYCFQCYEKANNAAGDQVIGRVNHLTAAGLYEKVSNIIDDPATGLDGSLFDNVSRGNLLQMNKWATFMNDAWLLGGMHRGANFRLASPRTLDNLWNQGGGYLVVTAREIIGLSAFGYRLEQVGPYQVFKQQTRAANYVNLIDYDDLIARKGHLDKALLLAQGRTGKAPVMNELLQRVPRQN